MDEAPAAAPDLVLRGRVVTAERVLPDALVAIGGGRISWVGPFADAAAEGWPVPQRVGTTLLPGLIDLHCHGGGGHSFPDGDDDASRAAARHHAAHGTSGIVASLVTAAEPAMLSGLAACADLVDEGMLVGIHLEGPFLAPARCGAQDPAFMRLPDPGLLQRLLDAGRGHVVSMTYAPELNGASALVQQLTSYGVVPSVGHTDADARTAAQSLSMAAAAAPTGRASVTHLFNGMRPFHHRDPGAAGASLAAAARGEAVVELVADGVHLADETVATVMAIVGPAAVALVTDAMAAAGMPDGTYRLGPRTVEVRDRVARLPTLEARQSGDPAMPQPPERSLRPGEPRQTGGMGDRAQSGLLYATGRVGQARRLGPLAGGTSRLLEIVRRCVQLGGIDLQVAVEAASRTPARLLGLADDRGSLSVGQRADVLAVNDDLTPVAVWSSGRRLDAAAGGS